MSLHFAQLSLENPSITPLSKGVIVVICKRVSFIVIIVFSGGLNIYNNRLTLLGSIQPGPLVSFCILV